MQTPRLSTRVLVVDDEESQRAALASMIALWGYVVETAADGQEALDKLATFPAHVLVTDLNMPRMTGQELLERLRDQPGTPAAIVQTAFGNLETAVSLIHDLGAFWFLEKPVQSQALRLLIERAAAQGKLAEHAERLERELSYHGVLGEMTGESEGMQAVFALIQQVAPSRAAVLITGESGTGKELAARAIHSLSPRRSGPFVAINCAALPDTLIESELFGHEKGAFTGALERRAGCFELAQNGTVLLDEIGDMPIGTQAKLLRVLEDQRVRRLGGKSEIQLDVRVIASTNMPLETSIREGKFREDLFYRLNVFPVALPPLRDRREDIPQLVSTLLSDMNRKHGTRVTDVAPNVGDALRAYNWPGNVRELRNVIERAAIVAGEGTIRTEHLPSGFGSHSGPAGWMPSSRHAMPGQIASGGGLGSAPGGTSQPTSAIASGVMSGGSLNTDELRLAIGSTIEQAERALIELTLEHTKNNKTRAAEILGISQKTLFNKLREYGAADGSSA